MPTPSPSQDIRAQLAQIEAQRDRKRARGIDCRDLVITQLADERADYEALAVSAVADCQAWRELALAALAALHSRLAAEQALHTRGMP